jgi:hypothetical protein
MKLLDLHKKQLTAADCSQETIEMYTLVLRHLNRLSEADFVRTVPTKKTNRHTTTITPEEINSLTLDQIESFASDLETPRKVLEEIAVIRFNVPRGSLRSFSNLRMLREKISTRVQNERTHETISSVARRTESSKGSGNVD